MAYGINSDYISDYFTHLKDELERRSREAWQRQEGEKRAIKAIARKMKAEGLNTDTICKMTGLTLDVVNSL